MKSVSRLPDHLRKYAVDQDYSRYTSEDQAVWRYIMHQLRDFLSIHGHECYRDGLNKTGILLDEIPRIEDIDQKLSAFGWGAVPVSGFIPPAAFMEFQSLAILPIASDMRSLDHLLYTPAPDIVHEAAGHAPILVHPEFAEYLRKYADVAKFAIIAKEDLDQYQAIRTLSDLKEHPDSTPEMIASAERTLDEVNQSIRHVSEAGLLSRMNWWTAEYGLIGDLLHPKIYGAGLLSSVGEAKQCLSDSVKKIPLGIHCIDFSYDITEPQPQLFVAENFQSLHRVLDELAARLSYRWGGVHGLQNAVGARTVNTVQLNSGVQISGVLESFVVNDQGLLEFLKFSGPCQLSVAHKEVKGQGTEHHRQGFSGPIGAIRGFSTPLSRHSPDELSQKGWRIGESIRVEYESGIVLEGKLQGIVRDSQHIQVMTFAPCHIRRGQEILFDPAWGEFDLAVGESVPSVFGGPADRGRFGEAADFSAERVAQRAPPIEIRKRYDMYAAIRNCRMSPHENEWSALVGKYLDDANAPWLMGMELLELGISLVGASDKRLIRLKSRLEPKSFSDPNVRQSIEDGLRLVQHIQ